jgi:hypothetical protein
MEKRFASSSQDDSFRSQQRELLSELMDEIHRNILDLIIDGFEFDICRMITASKTL